MISKRTNQHLVISRGWSVHRSCFMYFDMVTHGQHQNTRLINSQLVSFLLFAPNISYLCMSFCILTDSQAELNHTPCINKSLCSHTFCFLFSLLRAVLQITLYKHWGRLWLSLQSRLSTNHRVLAAQSLASPCVKVSLGKTLNPECFSMAGKHLAQQIQLCANP